MSNLNESVDTLIQAARTLGLREIDVKYAEKLLLNREYGLAFDTVVTQLYEYDVEINREFFHFVEKIGQRMNLPEGDYSFLAKLIRDDTKAY